MKNYIVGEDNKPIVKDEVGIAEQETLNSAREYIIAAQKQIYSTVNSAMVTAYWNIGKLIYEACGENVRAEYGKQLLKYLSEKLTKEFGKGFTAGNLRNMRQFYLTFPICDALRSELSWTHYRSLMRVSDDTARNYYLDEAVKSGWSSRQLVCFYLLFTCDFIALEYSSICYDFRK